MLADLPVTPMVPTEDLERARRFYELTLGFRLLQATSTEAWYECHSGTKLCLYRKPPQAGNVSVSWKVPNIDKVARQLTQKGVAFEGHEDLTGKADGPMAGSDPAQMLRFKDTEGNLVSLTQLQK